MTNLQQGNLRAADKVAIRKEFTDLLRRELIGPAGGPVEELLERPDKRYLMGMLFPKDAVAGQMLDEEVTRAADDLKSAEDSTADEGLDSPTDLMFQRLPASVGISFAVAGTGKIELDVNVGGASYEASSGGERGRKTWRRADMARGGTERHRLELGHEPIYEAVLNGRASLHALVRNGPERSRIVTVTLINEAELQPGERVTPPDCIFQVLLEVSCDLALQAWPTPERLFNDLEDDELALQYRDRPVLAIGHGCAADWSADADGRSTVCVEFMPMVEIAPITAEIPGLEPEAQKCLSLQFLQSDDNDAAAVCRALESFVAEYAGWRKSLDTVEVPDRCRDARHRVLQRIDAALERMRRGVNLLKVEPEALRCFRLANRAMLLQMVFAGRVKSAEKTGKVEIAPIDPAASKWSGLRWRPFQLAFQLISLRGLWQKEDPDRDIVDLIWFPTGGGKTEAYLAVAAFEMMRRRLTDGEGGAGTAVLMRYTLRLLTQQQFQRAGHLICALEMLRRDEQGLGREPFSLGLWVGNEVTPGDAAKAHKTYDTRLRQEVGAVANPFTLLRCPACGTSIVPESLSEQGAPGCGILSTTTEFGFFCPAAECDFHDAIPVQIVDELLYRNPPTMLLATLDKFAMMAWREEPARFFGKRGSDELQVCAPSLIIQDELHLIAGPLGTVAGIYEAAIDVAITSRGGRPKIIASTATTRRAAEQGLGLYARDVQVFPPAGLNAGDSFFTRTVEGVDPGRLYIGAMAQGHTPTFSNVLVSAALLSAVPKLNLPDHVEDSWWTLVAYHNSRRELGRSLTLARDDIPARIAALKGKGGGAVRRVSDVQELSANIKGDAIPVVLEALSRPKTSGSAVDYLGCTNMLSVGVDVDRLGLMLVLGQPKTASEYIQATSRVGRSDRHLPGIVVSLFMPTKPRDRSHYELFRPFHEAMYRHVEPSSVTPYALPARERAFHAAMIAAIRMATDLDKNDRAAKFRTDSPEVRQILDTLYERMKAADIAETIGIEQTAAVLERWWGELANPELRYSTAANARNYRPLIKRYGEVGQGEARETLQSMRHVDSNVRVKILGQPKKAEKVQ